MKRGLVVFVVFLLIASISATLVVIDFNSPQNEFVYDLVPPYVEPNAADHYYHFLAYNNGKAWGEIVVPSGGLSVKSGPANKTGVSIVFNEFSQMSTSVYFINTATILVPQDSIEKWKSWVEKGNKYK